VMESAGGVYAGLAGHEKIMRGKDDNVNMSITSPLPPQGQLSYHI
jgi:hypothetical protein